MSIGLHTFAERPELRDNAGMRGIHSVWPDFLLHDPVVNARWDRLYRECAEFQFFLHDDETDRVVAEGNSVPVTWDGLPQPGGASTGSTRSSRPCGRRGSTGIR